MFNLIAYHIWLELRNIYATSKGRVKKQNINIGDVLVILQLSVNDSECITSLHRHRLTS